MVHLSATQEHKVNLFRWSCIPLLNVRAILSWGMPLRKSIHIQQITIYILLLSWGQRITLIRRFTFLAWSVSWPWVILAVLFEAQKRIIPICWLLTNRLYDVWSRTDIVGGQKNEYIGVENLAIKRWPKWLITYGKYGRQRRMLWPSRFFCPERGAIFQSHHFCRCDRQEDLE